MSMTMTPPGRRVPARRFEFCFGCESDTVQWLISVEPCSPGNYRSVRLFPYYRCGDCGRVLGR